MGDKGHPLDGDFVRRATGKRETTNLLQGRRTTCLIDVPHLFLPGSGVSGQQKDLIAFRTKQFLVGFHRWQSVSFSLPVSDVLPKRLQHQRGVNWCLAQKHPAKGTIKTMGRSRKST